MRFLKVISFVLFFGEALFSQEYTDINLRKIEEKYQKYSSKILRQKVYLATDKEHYNQNDNIWIEAFVFSGADEIADTISDNLYVELWSPSGELAHSIMLALNKGSGHGSIYLEDTLEQGIYLLRAYTNLMRNQSAEYFFNKPIRFYNSNHSNLISPKTARKNRKKIKEIEKDSKELFVTFSVEGGNLIVGKEAKLYVRTHDCFGKFKPSKGALFNSNKVKISEISEIFPGLGVISFLPDPDMKYYLEFEESKRIKSKFEIPQPIKEGVWGRLDQKNDTIYLELSKPYLLSNDPSANRYYVIVHSGLNLLQTNVVDLRHDTVLTYQKAKFKNGIITYSVFNNRVDLVSEFKNFLFEKTKVPVTIDSKIFGDSLFLSFDSNKEIDNSRNSFSVTVYDSLPSIDNYFIVCQLLNSDLKGFHPFSIEELSNHELLDVFINTSQSITPSWNDLFDESFQPSYVVENNIEIEGRISSNILDFPLKDASIDLEVMDRYNDVFYTTTNSRGLFKFGGFQFYDTLDMKIIARTRKGKKNLFIELKQNVRPEFVMPTGDFFYTTVSTRDNKEYRRNERIKASNAIMEEEKELDKQYSAVLHGRPDQVIFGHELPRNQTVLESLDGRVPGLDVSANSASMRGRNKARREDNPMVLLDDIPTDLSVLNLINVETVERIEIIKGPSTAIYGSRGSKGVIAVYTKQGSFVRRGEIDFSVVGYHKPKNFFKYNRVDNEEYSDFDMPFTLIWLNDFNIPVENSTFSMKIPNVGKYLLITLEGVTLEGRPFSVRRIVEP